MEIDSAYDGRMNINRMGIASHLSRGYMKECSMPLTLSHKAFFKSAILQVTDKVPVASLALLSSLSLGGSATPSSRTSRVLTGCTFRGWRIVSRTGLQTNWLSWVKMARYSLDSDRYSSLLDLHGRRSCATRSYSSLLGINALLALLLRLLLMLWRPLGVLSQLRRRLRHHAHLVV